MRFETKTKQSILIVYEKPFVAPFVYGLETSPSGDLMNFSHSTETICTYRSWLINVQCFKINQKWHKIDIRNSSITI